MRVVGCVAAAVAIALIGQPAQADYKEEYRVSTVVPAPFPWGIAAEEWADLVRERTDGRINMRIYPGAQLVAGEQTREFTAMRRGIIDMAVGSTINWSPQIVELNIFSMPFLMPDYDAIDALTGGPVGELLFEIIRENGVVPLAWAENGFREVTNSRHAIQTPADMQGLKMRVVGSPIFNDIFTVLGANPTQMSWADAQPALTTGAVDGQENPVTIYSVLNMHELGQEYVTLWHYVADPLIFAVNEQVWESFTEEDREIVREATLNALNIPAEQRLAPGQVAESDPRVEKFVKLLEAIGARPVWMDAATHDRAAAADPRAGRRRHRRRASRRRPRPAPAAAPARAR